jgi:hypothetical protein
VVKWNAAHSPDGFGSSNPDWTPSPQLPTLVFLGFGGCHQRKKENKNQYVEISRFLLFPHFLTIENF